ncbi:MAG: Hpt domain-containing protein [Desulfobacterota bacterium]|nr:Hpt domain-containing protein [Thermodesulfobacteriota bacterium]
MNLQELADRIGLEEQELREMLEIFLRSGGHDLAALESALAAGDAQRAHEASHSLKGSAGSLGLDRIYQLAKAIDDKDRQGILDGLDTLVKELRAEYEALAEAVRIAANP